MEWLEFGVLLNDNITLYLVILVVSLLLYILLFKKLYLSILDPLIFNSLFSLFGFSVIWFLYFTHNLALKYLISYLLTQGAFWLGLFFFKSLKLRSILSKKKTFVFKDEVFFLKVLFVTTTLLYIIMQVLTYLVIGIPLLLGSHVDIYNNSGGWGVLGRIIDVLKPLSIFLLLYFIFNSGFSLIFNIYKYLFFLLLLVFFALSGSRGDFMTMGFILFCFFILNARNEKIKFSNIRKYEKIILIAGLCFVFLTIIVQSTDGGFQSSLSVFLFRLVASGDAYFFTYPHGYIETLNGSHPFLALFGDLFATLRLVSRDSLPVVLGLQIYRLFYTSDVTAGPNARHNVFGYVYFGFYGSIIFSFILGLILSFVRNKLFFSLRTSTIGQFLFILLYINCASFETDPPAAISNIENMVLILPVIIALALGVTFMLNRSRAVYALDKNTLH